MSDQTDVSLLVPARRRTTKRPRDKIEAHEPKEVRMRSFFASADRRAAVRRRPLQGVSSREHAPSRCFPLQLTCHRKGNPRRGHFVEIAMGEGWGKS